MRSALLAAAVLLPLLLTPAAEAKVLPGTDAVWAGWQAAYVHGGKAAATSSRPFLASTHEFPLIVGNDLGGPIRNVSLVVSAPRAPFSLTLEGPDGEDARPNETKPYAFWTAIPRPSDNLSQLGCSCGFVILHSEHSDEFSGSFEFEARLFFDAPNGTTMTATSLLKGSIAGGALRFQTWHVWLIGAALVAVIGAAVWMSRKKSG